MSITGRMLERLGSRKITTVLVLEFSSGLPLYLTGPHASGLASGGRCGPLHLKSEISKFLIGRVLGIRKLIEASPVNSKLRDCVDEIIEIHRFDDIAVHAQVVAVHDIAFFL